MTRQRAGTIVMLIYLLLIVGFIGFQVARPRYTECSPQQYSWLTDKHYKPFEADIRRAMENGWISDAEYRHISNKRYKQDCANEIASINVDSIKQVLK